MTKQEQVELIQGALEHFVNVCPYCERGIDAYVTDSEIEDWLNERKLLHGLILATRETIRRWEASRV